MPSDTRTPLLSIVIPAFNVERFVSDAVSSALAQTVADVEVIVVDDGSTDGTVRVLSGFGDPRLRVIRQPNRGVSAARNAGIAAARAPYVGFIDGDDAWEPNKAERHLALMESDPSIGISFSHSLWMDAGGRLDGRVLFTPLERPVLRDMLVRNVLGNGSSPVVRADCLAAAGPFDEDLPTCEDWEMWVRVLRDTGMTARLVPEALTRYRVNPDSLTMNFAGFLAGAERAAARIERDTPGEPRALVRRGLAICYRVAASKAFRKGDRRAGARYLAMALARSPGLPLHDPRFAAAVFLALAPRRAADAANKIAARAFGRGAAKHRHGAAQ